jgi:hypothetical protein
VAKTYKDQADNRMYETFRDQHGRFWGANIEINTGDPCEVLRPQFLAPITPEWARGILTPPEDVVEMVPRSRRAQLGYSVFVNYQKWLIKWDTRYLEREKKLSDYARGMRKDATAAVIAELLQNPTQDLLREVGRPPFPPRKLIEAMAANNQWALGKFNGINAKIQAILDEIQPVLAAAKERVGKFTGEDPLADDDDGTLNLTGEGDNGAPALVDPLGDLDDVVVAGVAASDLEEQYNPAPTARRPEPVGKARSPKPKRTE